MKDYLGLLNDYVARKASEGLRKEFLLQEALKQIHINYFTSERRNSTKQDSEAVYSTKSLLKALSDEKHRHSSLISEAKAGSQGTFYNLIRDDSAQVIADPLRKIIAILVFLSEHYGIYLTFDQYGDILIGENGRFLINIEQPNIRPVIETDVSDRDEIHCVAYYWRDDNQIGIATLKLYHYSERGKYFQQANMIFYYDNRKVSLTGKVQPSDTKHQDVSLNLFIHLEDDEDQKQENLRNPAAPVVTNLAISIPDTHKKWEEGEFLFGAYNSVHRKKERYAYAGIMYLMKVKRDVLNKYTDRKSIPDFIHYLLFQNRIHAPYMMAKAKDGKEGKEMIPGYSNTQVFVNNFVGFFYVWYVNTRHNTLEKSICEITPTGKVILTAYERVNKLEGQCLLVADLYCYIYFNFKQEGGRNYSRFTYTVERSTSEECLYAVYSGLNSHTDLISGRAYFEKVPKEEIRVPDLKSSPLVAGDRWLETLFKMKRKLYTYLIGDSYQLYSDSKSLSRYTEDSSLSKSRSLDQPDISGSYTLYTLDANLDPSEQNPDKSLCIAQYPVLIDRFGIIRIKGRLGEYSDRAEIINKKEYIDDKLVFHKGTFSGRFNISDNSQMEVLFYYERGYKQPFIKGIITRKVGFNDPILDSRVCLLTPYRNTETHIFDKVEYEDAIRFDSDKARKIDKETGGAISYLRGSLNRSLVVKIKDSLHPRRESNRRLHFYAACYLAKREPELCYPELERAFAHGFASREFMSKNIFNQEFDEDSDILSLRDDWNLLLIEISELGSLSSAKRLEQVKKLWKLDDLEFMKDKLKESVIRSNLNK